MQHQTSISDGPPRGMSPLRQEIPPPRGMSPLRQEFPSRESNEMNIPPPRERSPSNMAEDADENLLDLSDDPPTQKKDPPPRSSRDVDRKTRFLGGDIFHSVGKIQNPIRTAIKRESPI